MAFFTVNHLLDFELDYELAIRSVVTQRNMNDKRKILSKLIKKERHANVPGSQVHFEEYKYDFKTEEAAINKSIISITDCIIDFEGSDHDSAFAKIKSRLIHLTGRVNRLIVPENDTDGVEQFKHEAYATCIKLESDLDDKVIEDPQTPNVSFSPLPAQPVVNVNPVVSCSASAQPLSTWGVKFNGDPKQVFYFLERISDLAQARGVSDDDLFKSAVELFIGDAFIWYRSIRSSVNDWGSLVLRLKKDFLPPYSDDEIWDSIRQRKQKKNESITIFVAQLENLFNRLAVPVAEVTKVKYIKRNLLPEYIHQLALHPIDSLVTLTNLCRNLEEAAYLTSSKKSSSFQISSLQNNSSNNVQRHINTRARGFNNNRSTNLVQSQSVDSVQLTEPLASTSSSRPHASVQQSTTNKGQVVCFNCQMPNHTFRSCTLKRKVFCFRCGKPDVRVNACPVCSKN